MARSMAACALAALLLGDGHAQVVHDGQAGEDATAFGDVGQPEFPDAVCGQPGDVPPVEVIRPLVEGTRPETARASVLLPAPLAPSTARTVPGSTVTETPNSARDDP